MDDVAVDIHKSWTRVALKPSEMATMPATLFGDVLEDVDAYYFEDPRDALMVKLSIRNVD